MSSWSTIVLVFDKELRRFDDEISVPAALVMENGIDERFWLEEGKIFYAMSQGRYQHLRFDKMLEKLHDPMFTAVKYAAVTKAEDTGDTAEVMIYEPNSNNFDGRKDGYIKTESFEGERMRDREKDLKKKVKKEYGFEPVIDPINESIKPDMVMKYTGDDE